MKEENFKSGTNEQYVFLVCVFGSPSDFGIIFCKVTNWLALSFTDFTVHAWPFTAQSLQHSASLLPFPFIHSFSLTCCCSSIYFSNCHIHIPRNSNTYLHTHTRIIINGNERTKKKWKRVVKLQHEVWFRCMAFREYMAGRFSFILPQKQTVFVVAVVVVLFSKSMATIRWWVAEESEICSPFSAASSDKSVFIYW